MASLPDEPIVAVSVALAVAGSLLAFALAAVVLRAGPRQGVHGRLAALLVAEGLVHAMILTRLEGLSPAVLKALAVVHVGSVAALPSLYLLFLATLSTPLVRALRGDGVRAFLVTYAVLAGAVGAVLVAITPLAQSGPPAPLAALYRSAIALLGAASLWGLVAAVSEVRRAAPGSPARGRALAYAAAFGGRDVFFGLTALNVLVLHDPPTANLWPSLATFVFVPLLAYGFLRTRLFDIDLRIKWTVERGTVALVFVGLYLAASQAAQATVAARHGPLVGLGAAALLVFALVPLRRFGRRVAETILPGVADTPEYVARRKVEIYRAALEQACTDRGEIDPAQRPVLASLRDSLGLAARDAAVVEHAVASARRAPDGALVPGETVLGKYRVVRLLGEGAQGRTYLVEQTAVGRPVVVKVLRALGPQDAADALREARATAAVRHPHVVTLHDVEQSGTRVLLVMEHVEGGSLRDRLEAGPLAPTELRRVGDGLLAALDAVHRAGGVHRDVKPSNVLLTRDGEPKLADFGIARVPGLDRTVGLRAEPETPAGTARYLSPEQARGLAATARSDLYSAAVTLYEACTGEPWLAPKPEDDAATLRARAAAAGPFDRAVEPPALAAWFARALDPDPARRFASAAEARAALQAALASVPA